MEAKIENRWDPAGYARHAGFVPELAGAVLGLLAARPGERILDLGCGDGVLTEQLVALGCEVVGVDSSAEQIAAARARGLDARVVDGERLPFRGEFDAVFSNAALHWMRAPDAVLSGVHAALRPGGRFVAEMGGHGCVAAIRVALAAVLARRGLDAVALSPWYFPSADAYEARLVAAGLRVSRLELVARPTLLPTDLHGWLETFAGSLLRALPEAERTSARDEVVTLAAPVLRDSLGRWFADYTRLRFVARRADG